jgi:putative glutamine transport system substrate-binding protein
MGYTQAQQAIYQSWNKVAEQRAGQLNVMYFENYPFAYNTNKGETVGIEIDILREFANWLKEYKGVQLALNFKKYDGFEKFYASIRDGGNGMIGAGSVTINSAREKEVQFTAPYLKNISVLVSSLEVNSLVYMDEFPKVFKDRVALVVKGSSHEKELMKIKEKHFPEMKISYVKSPKEMLMRMKEDPNTYGYVDIITYWAFTQEQGGILRIHRVADINKETFGFIFPPNSDWPQMFKEFMLGGFGFTSTAEYHAILDKYLDVRISAEVELK